MYEVVTVHNGLIGWITSSPISNYLNTPVHLDVDAKWTNLLNIEER